MDTPIIVSRSKKSVAAVPTPKSPIPEANIYNIVGFSLEAKPKKRDVSQRQSF